MATLGLLGANRPSSGQRAHVLEKREQEDRACVVGVLGSHALAGEPGELECPVTLPASCFSSAVSTGAAIVCNEGARQAGVSGVCGEPASGLGRRRAPLGQEVTQGPDEKRRGRGPG